MSQAAHLSMKLRDQAAPRLAAADVRIKELRSGARRRLPTVPHQEIAVGLVMLVGLALAVYGLHCIYAPLGPLAGGLLLFALAVGYERGKS